MAKSKSSTKKTTKKVPTKKVSTSQNATLPKQRKLKSPKYKSFRVHKRIKSTQPKLSNAFSLFRKTIELLINNWKLFGGIVLVYAFLTIILVRGFGSEQNLTEAKNGFNELFKGKFGGLPTTALLFSTLLGSIGSSSTPTGSVYQSLLLIIVGLATIWAFRQNAAGKTFKVKDTFYKGLYPLVPFILLLMVIGLQLLPMAIGSWIYSTVISNGIAVTVVEKSMWLIMFILLALLSMYMICSSLFGLFIVTLPDMTPMRALRSARQLVIHRRWSVIRKIIFLPFAMLVLTAVIMLPFLLFFTAIAAWVFFLLTMLGWVVTLGYLYSLYRELLGSE